MKREKLKLDKGSCRWTNKNCPRYRPGRTTMWAKDSEFDENCPTCHKYTHFKFDILNAGEININKDEKGPWYILLISYYIDGELRRYGRRDYLEDIGGFEFGVLYPISEIDKINKKRKPVSFFKRKNSKKTLIEMLVEDINKLSETSVK